MSNAQKLMYNLCSHGPHLTTIQPMLYHSAGISSLNCLLLIGACLICKPRSSFFCRVCFFFSHMSHFCVVLFLFVHVSCIMVIVNTRICSVCVFYIGAVLC